MKILVINVGSTSLKFRLFEMPAEKVLASGRVERVGSSLSPCSYQMGSAPRCELEQSCPDQRTAIGWVLKTLGAPSEGVLHDYEDLDAIGFKPVHARNIAEAVFIDEKIITAMEEYTPLVPSHNPPYIAAFRIFQELLPHKPLVGVFEPAFHKTIPDYARTYGIPYELTEKYDIRRYGFHGASHRYISWRVPEMVGRCAEELKIISCHLGGSSSVCAIRGGISIDTSMGFSAQCGLPNATRNGDLDPFVLLYLMEKEGWSTEQLRKMLSSNGGLKGISGLSGDMRDLETAAETGNQRARLAIDVLAHETRKYIGAYTAVLGGVDVLAFAGGIGENSIQLRRQICTGLECLGIRLDAARNEVRGQERLISREDSPVKIAVVLTNEELVIARETQRLLREKTG
jgi:acetate kinase